ncbi:MAG: aminotransferase class I/II-fold pyridoxal phosphate-dependent enzyme [Rhodospirillales bacterium]|jgi:N-succinyldiaminopimelate aminotransferase|nr:aminotransferase class I/II-fold pyridoxal phosphate-dependent enzyme [Rhodospirillales bacterium]
MLNPHLTTLTDYPFDRLRALLDGTPPGAPPIALSVGEPRHPPPPWLGDVLAAQPADWGRYPPIEGTPDFRAAVAGWLTRRYALPADFIDADRHVLPVAGTREGLFLIALAVLPERKAGGRPVVLLPNPFYQVYLGAAVVGGAEPVLLPAGPASGFLPDLDALPAALLDRTAIFYLCSPANPQGAIADAGYLEALIGLARRHDFVLIVDECYAEIYDRQPPAGALAAAAALGDAPDRLAVFHSLSKRSSVPGLRSGFVAGDAAILAAFRRLRAYGGATLPLPVLAASAALWRDEAHVAANRALYRAKFDAAERWLAGRFGFYRPAGGFFLWLDVGDGEAAALRLWRQAGVRVLPGAYLGRADAGGVNPGAAYIRIALTADLATTEDALRRLVNAL